MSVDAQFFPAMAVVGRGGPAADYSQFLSQVLSQILSIGRFFQLELKSLWRMIHSYIGEIDDWSLFQWANPQ